MYIIIITHLPPTVRYRRKLGWKTVPEPIAERGQSNGDCRDQARGLQSTVMVRQKEVSKVCIALRNGIYRVIS